MIIFSYPSTIYSTPGKKTTNLINFIALRAWQNWVYERNCWMQCWCGTNESRFVQQVYINNNIEDDFIYHGFRWNRFIAAATGKHIIKNTSHVCIAHLHATLIPRHINKWNIHSFACKKLRLQVHRIGKLYHTHTRAHIKS